MLKFLKEVWELFKNKFVKFLLEVWNEENNTYIENSYKFVNELVKNVENIGEYVIKNKETDSSILANTLEKQYGYKLYVKDIDKIKSDKSQGKADLVERLTILRMKNEKKDYKKSIIRLCIELAVNRGW